MRKIFVIIVLLISLNTSLYSQSTRINLGGYDDVNTHFGFLLGAHSTYYRIYYSQEFLKPNFNNLHSVHSKSMPGFKLGFVSDFSLIYPFDLRTLLQVSFSEFRLDYYNVDEFTGVTTTFSNVRPAVFLESPILFKYKSKRRKNHRMFLIAGIKPSLEIGAKNKDEAGEDILDLKAFDISLEVGFGSDLFFQLFKFSPEIRYSRGLRNILKGINVNQYNLPLDRIIVHNISFFFTFEGGPK